MGNEVEAAALYLRYIMFAFYFHKYDKAKFFSETFKKYIDYVDRDYVKAYFIFYDGMIKLAVDAKNIEFDGRWKDDVKGCISDLRRYAEICPINFLNKLRLLEAGLEEVENNLVQ